MDRQTQKEIISTKDSCFDEKIKLWLEEELSDTENISDIDNSDHEEDVIVESEHDSVSEQSCESDCEQLMSFDSTLERKKFFYGKGRYKWSKEEFPKNVRTPSHNILKIPFTKKDFRETLSHFSSFNMVFSDEMLNIIIKYTNVKLKNIRQNLKDPERIDYRDISRVELLAFIGLLIYTACFKSNNEDLSAMFSTDGTGREIYRAVMSLKRFQVLLLALRFDNPDDRETRKISNKAAAIGEILDIFFKNSQKVYSVGSNCTVDEMLIPFRGKCSFRMYMPNKPAKYGLKLQVITDSSTNYAFNGYLYCGKGSDGAGLTQEERKLSVPSQAILHLCKPIAGSNRNITADNWYSSIEIVEILKKLGLTYVGTLKKKQKTNSPRISG